MFRRLPLLVAVAVLGSDALRTSQGADDKPPAVKELPARRVTLANEIKLSEALKQIKKQTDIDVQRPDGSDDPVLKFDRKVDQFEFWRALDAVARAADLRVTPYLEGGKIGLVKHPRGYRELPVSYSGPFRVTFKRIMQARDLEDGFNYSIAWFEIAWEPGFQAYYLQTQPQNLVIQAGGAPVEALSKGTGQAGVDHRIAVETDIRMEGVSRKAAKFDKLEGTFFVVGSPKMVTFNFPSLVKGQKKEEGVALDVDCSDRKKFWEVTITLNYPPGAGKFESFQSWLINNQCTIVTPQGERIEGGEDFETVPGGGGKTTIIYRFADKRLQGDGKDNKGWKPDQCKLVYRTPAQIIEVPVKFSFADVPLPSSN